MLSVQVAALAAPGLFLVFLCVFPPAQWLLRRWSDSLSVLVSKQVSTVVKVQQLASAKLTPLVQLSALTVSVDFYLVSLPLIYMSGLRTTALELTAGLAMATHITCALKDMLAGPRPAQACLSTPHARTLKVLEANHEREYGAPSMHTSLAIFMNGFAAFLVHRAASAAAVSSASSSGSDVPLAAHHSGGAAAASAASALDGVLPGATTHVIPTTDGSILISGTTGLLWPPPPHVSALYAAAGVWVVWVAVGRLYLGVHTPVDLGAGAGVGAALLAVWAVLSGCYAQAVITAAAAHTWQLLGCVLALVLYPTPPEYSTSYLYAVTFLGAWCGLALPCTPWWGQGPGRRLTAALLAALPPGAHPALVALNDHSSMGMTAARIAVGSVLILAARALIKAALVALLPRALGLLPHALRRRLQPPICPDGAPETAASGDKRMCREDSGAGNASGGLADAAGGDDAAASAQAAVDSSATAGPRRRKLAAAAAEAGAPDASHARGAADAEVFVCGSSGKAAAAAGSAHSAGATGHAPASPHLQAVGPHAIDRDGVLYRVDGLAWDADVLRRFIGYMLTVWAILVYTQVLDAASGWEVGSVVVPN